MCLAAGGSALSGIGLGFLAVDSTIRWILPAVLLLGLAGEIVAARRHRRWWILALGVIGSAILYAGWFTKTSPVLYSGMGLLFTASALTFWAKRHPVVPAVPLVQISLRRK